MRELCSQLKRSVVLRELNIADNPITSDSSAAIGYSCTISSCLRRGRNTMAMRLCRAAFGQSPSLTSLDLGALHLGDEGIIPIIGGLQVCGKRFYSLVSGM